MLVSIRDRVLAFAFVFWLFPYDEELFYVKSVERVGIEFVDPVEVVGVVHLAEVGEEASKVVKRLSFDLRLGGIEVFTLVNSLEGRGAKCFVRCTFGL